MKKILIINLCKEKLSSLEFINPLVKIHQQNKITIKNYKEILTEKKTKEFDKIILSGTALIDFDYLNYIENFKILKRYKKEIIGICSGAQVIAKLFNLPIKKLKTPKIGVYNVKINSKKHKCYFITSYLFESNEKDYFIKKNIKLFCFHPEVYNENLIK